MNPRTASSLRAGCARAQGEEPVESAPVSALAPAKTAATEPAAYADAASALPPGDQQSSMTAGSNGTGASAISSRGNKRSKKKGKKKGGAR